MFYKSQKAKRWTKKLVKKNLKKTSPINCEDLIHPTDKAALAALKKIPLLDKICEKVLSILNETQQNIINMSSKVQITERQIPEIYFMVKSICNKLGIEMPQIYLTLDREPNAYVIGYKKYTMVIHSGLLECFEDDEIYAVLAHECGHIACKHMLYHTVAAIVLNGSIMGLNKIGDAVSAKGLMGSVLGGVISAVDGALELAFYHWYRCSELSADRVAAICCGSQYPVIETMMRLAGGTTNIGYEINKDLFIAQAEEYQNMVSKNAINKTLEFLLTKDYTHPLLSVRASEVQKFANREDFKKLL